MRADQRRVATGGRALERSPPVTEAEEQVLLVVGEAAEREHVRGRGEAVGEPERDRHVGPHRRRRWWWSSSIVMWTPMLQS